MLISKLSQHSVGTRLIWLNINLVIHDPDFTRKTSTERTGQVLKEGSAGDIIATTHVKYKTTTGD
jgi:hypothetical protein